MSKYRDILDDFFNSLVVRDQETFMTVGLPIFFGSHNESIAISVRENENGFLLSDCHTVADFWELADIDTAAYADRIKLICDSFGVWIDGNNVLMQVYVEDACSARFQHAVGDFLQALSLLGNIYI